MIVQNNGYQSAAFFNSSNYISGTILNFRNGIVDYLDLKEENDKLARENAALRQRLFMSEMTRLNQDHVYTSVLDPELAFQYEFETAEVINNSTRRFNNFITIDKGSLEGLKPGMGVIGSQGVVGKVKAVSSNFATVMSLLHADVMISSKLVDSNTFCTTEWDGKNPKQAMLMYVPRHIIVEKGDTVVTSGFNSVFPENVMIGVIDEVGLKDNAAFYDIVIDLSTDFSTLSKVYICKNSLREEKDSLEINSMQIYE